MAISAELRAKLEKAVHENSKLVKPLSDKALASHLVSTDAAFAEIDLAGYHIVTIRKRLGLGGSRKKGKKASGVSSGVTKTGAQGDCETKEYTLDGLDLKIKDVLNYFVGFRKQLRAKVEQVFLSSAETQESSAE